MSHNQSINHSKTLSTALNASNVEVRMVGYLHANMTSTLFQSRQHVRCLVYTQMYYISYDLITILCIRTDIEVSDFINMKMIVKH